MSYSYIKKNKNYDINSLNDMHNDGFKREDFSLGGETIISHNFAVISEELKAAKNNNNFQIDKTTNFPMYNLNIGLRNFDFECCDLENVVDNKTLNRFALNGKLLLMKFKRKNRKDLMSIDEIRKYIDIKNGNIVFLRKVDPEIIYKIAKSLNSEFYFIVNSQDNVIPMFPAQAELIFKKKQNFVINSNMHIGGIFDRNFNKQRFNNLQSAFYDWFCNNVNHMHPYAYSDMVITEQIKKYSFKKKENGNEFNVKTQFSNELTDKLISLSNIKQLRGFAQKCQKALFTAISRNEEHVFAMPFPLYSKNHMLSLVIVFRPNGVVNATIINANGYRDARHRYAIPIGNILQRVFEKYAPNVGKKINYFFHENRSQFDGTCMTHADCITKRLVKDRELNFDGKNLHPVKIWEKAYIRGFATTIYQHAKKQNAFIQSLDKEKQLNENQNFAQNINNSIYTDKIVRDLDKMKKRNFDNKNYRDKKFSVERKNYNSSFQEK